MRLHLLGVVRADHRIPPGLHVRLVASGDLAVAAADAPVAALPHFEMLSALVTTGPVVPLVFGTLAENEEAVRTEVLPPIADQVRSQLDLLADVVEAHVYLPFDGRQWTTPDTVLAPITALARQTAALPGERDEVRRAFLLPRGHFAAAHEAAANLGATFVGPLPAFSFLDSGSAPKSGWGW